MTTFQSQPFQEIPTFAKVPAQRNSRNPPLDMIENSKPSKISLASISHKSDLNSTNSSSRQVFLRSYTNKISSILMNDENIENPLTQLEKIPSIEYIGNEQPPTKLAKTKTKQLKFVMPNSNLNRTNHTRTSTSIGGSRPKVSLTSLTSLDSHSNMAQSSFPLKSPDAGSHFLYKGSSSRILDKGEYSTRNNETSLDKTWRITTQRSVSKMTTNIRETRINKILQEVQERMNNQASLEDSKRFCINLQVVKVDAEAMKKNENEREFKVPQKILKPGEISKKLNDYCEIFNSQLEDLQKVKPHLHVKNKSLSERNLLIRTKTGHTIRDEIKKKDSLLKKEDLKRKFAKTIKTILRKLTHMNLTVDEIISNQVFATEPYQREGSKLFLDAVKNGDYAEIKRLINLNPYFVYDFDSLKQTALHWAAKRGFTAIVNLLLKNGADFDAQDLSGRTPLLLAAKGGFLDCVKILLFFGADPTIRSGAGKLALDYTTNIDIRNLLEKAFKIHVRLSVCSHKEFQQNWSLLDKRDFEVKMDQI